MTRNTMAAIGSIGLALGFAFGVIQAPVALAQEPAAKQGCGAGPLTTSAGWIGNAVARQAPPI